MTHVPEDEWIELEPVKTPGTGGPSQRADVEFGMRKMRDAQARGVITFAGSVLKRLNLSTWRVRIRLGVGGQKDRLAIIGDPQGPFELREVKSPRTGQGTGRFHLALPPIDTFPDASIAPEARQFEVGAVGAKSAIFVNLPPYCWKDELRVREEARYRKSKGVSA